MLGLEVLTVEGANEFVRGHAAAWWFLGKARLRFEQACNFVINAIVKHVDPIGDRVYRIASCSVVCEKHPDPAKRRPRPLWASVEGTIYPDGPIAALEAMLGRAPACRSMFLETDGRGGDPARASQWVHMPIEDKRRAEMSLHSLLKLVGVSEARVASYHAHSAKRFMMHLAERSPNLSEADSLELMGSSLSVSQRAELQPHEELLRAHTIRASQLPRRYAGSAVISNIMDRLAAADREISRASDAMAAAIEANPEADLDPEGGFEFL